MKYYYVSGQLAADYALLIPSIIFSNLAKALISCAY